MNRRHYRHRQRLPVPAQKRLARIFGEIGEQLGYRAEDAVERTFQNPPNGKHPVWFINWERTKRRSRLDKGGVDFVCITDVGELNLQIKSSEMYKKKFESQNRGQQIRVVVIDVRKSDAQNYGYIMNCLSEWRREKLIH